MRTKIYGTIGPACRSVETLRRLFAEGMTGVRLNLSHTSLADAAGWIANIQHAYESQSGEAGTKGVEIIMDLQGPELRIGTLREPRKLSEGEKVILAEAVGEGQSGEAGTKGVEIIMDLQGPELRIGTLREPRKLSEGEKVILAEAVGEEIIPVPGSILPHLTRGQELLLDDGQLLLMVEETSAEGEGGAVSCTVVRGGCLRSRKSLALPGTSWKAPTLTDCDLRNIRDARRFGITGVMLPFVRSVMLPFVRNASDLCCLREALEREHAADVRIFAKIENMDGVESLPASDLCCLREALEREHAADVRIFAKIENMDGVESLPELLAYCDEIVIARGDLGNSMPLWRLPVVQARMAERCRRAGKPFMVVTQLLASMETKQIPTRAEVSDIFCAVTEGASSVMLTGETAAGNYPVEAMHYLVQMETKQIPTRAEVSDIFCAVTEGASSVMLTGETAAGNYPVEAMHYLVQTVRETEAYMAESAVRR